MSWRQSPWIMCLDLMWTMNRAVGYEFIKRFDETFVQYALSPFVFPLFPLTQKSLKIADLF